jgi:hypothetical protein
MNNQIPLSQYPEWLLEAQRAAQWSGSSQQMAEVCRQEKEWLEGDLERDIREADCVEEIAFLSSSHNVEAR